MRSLAHPQSPRKGLQLCKVIRVECVAIFANQKPTILQLVDCMAPDCKLCNLRGNRFTVSRASGKIQVVGGVGRKPFGVDSAGGFSIGGVGVVVHCGHPLHRSQFGALCVQHLHQFAYFGV